MKYFSVHCSPVSVFVGSQVSPARLSGEGSIEMVSVDQWCSDIDRGEMNYIDTTCCPSDTIHHKSHHGLAHD